MPDPTVHEDTKAWLDEFSKYLSALGKAYSGPNATDEAHIAGFATIEPNPYKKDEAFPKAEGIEKYLVDKLKTMLSSKTQVIFTKEAIPLIRQLNQIEAFRRAVLGRKQRRKHLLGRKLLNGAQISRWLGELNRLLLNGPLTQNKPKA